MGWKCLRSASINDLLALSLSNFKGFRSMNEGQVYVSSNNFVKLYATRQGHSVLSFPLGCLGCLVPSPRCGGRQGWGEVVLSQTAEKKTNVVSRPRSKI